MLIDINEDFRKICSIAGDKLKDFGGELVKGRGGGGGRSLLYCRRRTQRCFRGELEMGRNLQLPTNNFLMALENAFKVLLSSLIQPCNNKYLISEKKEIRNVSL